MRATDWLIGALLLALAPAAAAESNFDREIRLLEQWLAVRDGSILADVGAGEGEYAIALSRAVGDTGQVFATELGADQRREIEAAASEAGAARVAVVEAQIAATGLSDACCDGVFLRGVYHHLTEPEAFGRSLFATLRPGGRLVIIDFPPSFWLALWTPKGIPGDRGGHGIAPEALIRELEAAGFVHVETLAKWPGNNFVTRQYAVVFERPAGCAEHLRSPGAP